MDVLITLPKNLIEKILSGEKRIEMRKNIPMQLDIGNEGFYVVEKATDKIRCWCRVSHIDKRILYPIFLRSYAAMLCVSEEYLLNYAPPPKGVYLWVIAEVIELSGINRDKLGIHKNPQSYAYVLTKRSSVLNSPF